ncbi:MAG: hypothetical protein OEW39_04900 [Deltaproteobacteria bacterium]|nr:hypothetical protein [Deltaproteobacteria bacterium]
MNTRPDFVPKPEKSVESKPRRRMLRTSEANPIQRILIEIYGLSVGFFIYSLAVFIHFFRGFG